MIRYILGEQYAELKGKIKSQRVLDVEGPLIETSVLMSGTMKGTQVQEMVAFTGTPTAEKGVIHAYGKGVVMTTTMSSGSGADSGRAEPEMITYTGQGVGRLSSSGNVSGAVLYSSGHQPGVN